MEQGPQIYYVKIPEKKTKILYIKIYEIFKLSAIEDKIREKNKSYIN